MLAGVLLLSIVDVMAQTPEWADDAKRSFKFPDREYLVGFASEKNTDRVDQQEFLNRIEGNAKSQLIEFVQVKVSSESTQEVNETNDNLTRKFKSMYSASSTLDLTGLKVDRAYDPKTRMGYAMAYAKRSDLIGYYKGLIETGLTKASQKVEEAKTALGKNDSQHTLKACLEASNTLPEVEQAQKVLLAIRTGNVTEADLQNERTAKIRSSIEEIIRDAQRSSGNTIEEASFFIARGLKLQTGKVDLPILLSNFTYQDTKMASELSRRLTQSLALKMVGEGGYTIETESVAGTKGYVLTGTYWKEPADIKIIGTLKDLRGKIVATAEAFIPLSWFSNNNISYLPENFEEAYSKMRVFGKNEIIKGDLNVEVWTNKGEDNLLYTEGEILKFYLRANKECYIRFIYHLADGQSVLMLDNYYIAENMVNKVVELPNTFECAEPFGVETLQVNDQTTEFPKLNTKTVSGYHFISNTLEDVLVSTRGFKDVRELKDSKNKEVQKAEKRLIFTTMAKK
jgi:hypothetical protein